MQSLERVYYQKTRGGECWKLKDESLKAFPKLVSCLERISERKAIRLKRLPAHKNKSLHF